MSVALDKGVLQNDVNVIMTSMFLRMSVCSLQIRILFSIFIDCGKKKNPAKIMLSYFSIFGIFL